MSKEKEKICERFLELQERFQKQQDELEQINNELSFWTDSLDELSEIEKAFEADNLHGKTILDIGTDCVKPLYIALKYEPDKIIGINELLTFSYAADLKQNSKLFVDGEIEFYNCSFFNKAKLNEILTRENSQRLDIILLSKTLHHLRTGNCIAVIRDSDHKHEEDERSCIYQFEKEEIFSQLLELGKRVIVYETYYPEDEDDDKVRGRGGYFTLPEWRIILEHLVKNYKVELFQPVRCSISIEEFENIFPILRQVDYICFYVEEKQKSSQV